MKMKELPAGKKNYSSLPTTKNLFLKMDQVIDSTIVLNFLVIPSTFELFIRLMLKSFLSLEVFFRLYFEKNNPSEINAADGVVEVK